MADQNNSNPAPQPSGGGNSGLAFIVGALVVAVGVMGYFLFVDGEDDPSDVTISIEGAGDALEGAAESVEGAASAVEDAAEQ